MGQAEKKSVTLCLEMLNTRVINHPMKGHPGYQGDHTDYCIDIIKRVGSPSLKLLFDIYHVQIMDGDIITRLRQYKEYIGHVHTAGNPGRGELDDKQEINYPPIMKASWRWLSRPRRPGVHPDARPVGGAGGSRCALRRVSGHSSCDKSSSTSHRLLPTCFAFDDSKGSTGMVSGGSTKALPGFPALGLDPRLVGALADLGYEEPTPIQREAIPPMLEGKDLVGQAATGTGKTAAFALPLLQRLSAGEEGAPRPFALILVPTRSWRCRSPRPSIATAARSA